MAPTSNGWSIEMTALFEEAGRYRPLVVNFAQREMKARYKRSLLGWLWSLINPLSIVVTYSLVFGVFLRVEPPATANGNAEVFALYLFSGLIVWNLFSHIINGSMDALLGVMDMRKKAYFPTETALMGMAVATGVQTLFEVAVLLVLMIVLANISWTFLLLPLILLGAASFAIGIGFFVSILNVRYRDVRHAVGIVLQLGFFLVPVIYTLELIQGLDDSDTYGLPADRIIGANPVTQFVTAAHDAVYFLRVPSAWQIAGMALYATVPPVLGLAYFRRRSMAISEEL